ncbi:MAG: Dethiobiotin synthetase [Cyanobacteria bacterium P01_A01_bin.105]
MDYKTACDLLTQESSTTQPDAFLTRLQASHPPIPGQVTSLLLALKVVADRLKHDTVLERTLARSLFDLAYGSRQYYEDGRVRGAEWPPLLDEDLRRIAIAVRQIMAGVK